MQKPPPSCAPFLKGVSKFQRGTVTLCAAGCCSSGRLPCFTANVCATPVKTAGHEIRIFDSGLPLNIRKRKMGMSIIRATADEHKVFRILEKAGLKDRITAVFDKRAESYDTNDLLHPKLALKLVDMADVRPGDMQILDVATEFLTASQLMATATTHFDSGETYGRRAILKIAKEPLTDGTGLVAIAAAQLLEGNGHVIGLDISEKMLKKAGEKGKEFGCENLIFKLGDAETVDFLESSFDVITCSSAVLYLENIPSAMSRFRTWLKPGGRLLFNTPQEPMVPAIKVVYDTIYKHTDIQLLDVASSFGSIEAVKLVLTAAGYSSVKVFATDELMVSPDTSPAQYAFNIWNIATGKERNPFQPLAKVISKEKLESFKKEALQGMETMAQDMKQGNDLITPYKMIWAVATKL